ncbi:hypothetical protein H9I48_00440 [Wolbachia pipientis]|nr:hypothetical protein [Wolbachia pipientis]
MLAVEIPCTAVRTVYGVICSAYGVTIGSKLSEVSCSNVDGNKQTV